jgi:hypothetical protein
MNTHTHGREREYITEVARGEHIKVFMATVLSRPQRGDLYQQGSRLPASPLPHTTTTEISAKETYLKQSKIIALVKGMRMFAWLVLLISEHTQL